MPQALGPSAVGDAPPQVKVLTSPLHGGKTAPRLLADLAHYNPQKLPPNTYNVLTQAPLPFNEKSSPPKYWSNKACRHTWELKQRQTVLSKSEAEADSDQSLRVAACCGKCRAHIVVEIEPAGAGDATEPCLMHNSPLHHFMYQNDRSEVQETDAGLVVWLEHFACSFPNCSTRLKISYRTARLPPELVPLLTDRSKLNARAHAVIEENSERFQGHAPPTPLSVLAYLKAYLNNALTQPESRRIVGNNKKWLLSFGEPCAELVEFIGFTRDGDDWIPPRPDASIEEPFVTPGNIMIEDVETEVVVLMALQPDEDRRREKLWYSLEPAMPLFERLLGCKGYKTTPASRTIDLNKTIEHPFYAGLGATENMHDELITFAYDRQAEVDPQNEPYYLECIQGLAKGRNSESLQTKSAIEESSGKYSAADVRDAHRSFGFEYGADYLDDDTVIGTFQARVSDAPKQEADLRRALNIIGIDRRSARIQQLASNAVTNYDQALLWLNATSDMNNEFLVSMYTVKVNESQADEALARKAMSIIAKHRNDFSLERWLETGQLEETDMDVGEAYNRLGITDRTIEDDMIATTYNLLVGDQPSQIEELRRAVAAIAKSKNSSILDNLLGGAGGQKRNLGDWPVGLENIGNTCYLNSLLQFYFTVKPLRELVLNFDKYKMPIDSPEIQKKQVGSRKVGRKEIERAQRFVVELRKLFQSMITSPKAEVLPEQELARLTLISSMAEETIRRQSILSGTRPSLGEIYGKPIQGPLPPPAVMKDGNTVVIDSIVPDATPVKAPLPPKAESSSDGTLVDAPAEEPSTDHDFMMVDHVDQKEQQKAFEDKENLPPSKVQGSPTKIEAPLSPLKVSSPSRTNEQPEKKDDGPIDLTSTDSDLPKLSEAPARPPPIPPRQRPDEEKKAIQEEVEIGAQQDVTEVIANVLFQLQCAIEPEYYDDSGEQIDQVKKLFFGKLKSYTTNANDQTRTKEEFFTDIKVDVASGPRDIYAALDGAFDVQDVEVSGKMEPQYATISQLPPVLQIHVQRAQFDAEKKTSFKSVHHLELKEVIYMDRYMDDPANKDLQQRRKECWKWKNLWQRMDVRTKRWAVSPMGFSKAEIYAMSADMIAQMSTGDPEFTVEVKAGMAEEMRKQAKKASDQFDYYIKCMAILQTRITSQFVDMRQLPYRLHAVFTHRGHVTSGHYWIYIYDPARQIWRKYNDDRVDEVSDLKEIFATEDGPRPATPYFLVYVKEGQEGELVDAVCRDVPEAEEAEEAEVRVEDWDAGWPKKAHGVGDEMDWGLVRGEGERAGLGDRSGGGQAAGWTHEQAQANADWVDWGEQQGQVDWGGQAEWRDEGLGGEQQEEGEEGGETGGELAADEELLVDVDMEEGAK